MHMKGLGLGGLFAIVGLVGCGSSGGSTGSGGTNGAGGSGKAGITGTAGNGSAGHTGSGGTTGTGSGFTTSIGSGTKITGLTSGQATQLCSDIESYENRTLTPITCPALPAIEGLDAANDDLIENSSATGAELQAACTARKADAGTCPISSSADAGLDSCDISSVPSTCTATVGDLTACLDDMVTSYSQFVAAIPTCTTLTPAIVAAYFAADGGGGGPADPASCAVIESDACNVPDDSGTNDSPKMPLRTAAMARAFRK